MMSRDTEKQAAIDLAGELHTRHGPDLLAHVYGMVGDYHAAQDVVQETFRKYCDRHKNGDSPCQPQAWLRRVAANAALNLIRGRRAQPAEAGQWEAFELPTVDPEVSHETVQLAEALETLRPAARELLELRAFDELSFSEIAAICGCTENAARLRYDRICGHVRKLLRRRETIQQSRQDCLQLPDSGRQAHWPREATR